MFTSTGFLLFALFVIVVMSYATIQALKSHKIDSAENNYSGLKYVWLFGISCLATGLLVGMNPMVSSTATNWLSSLGVLSADFVAELPTVEPLDTTNGYEWENGKTTITVKQLPGDNHQWNVQLPGQKPQKLEGTTIDVPAGTPNIMIWRQRVKPAVASEVRVITPNK